MNVIILKTDEMEEINRAKHVVPTRFKEYVVHADQTRTGLKILGIGGLISILVLLTKIYILAGIIFGLVVIAMIVFFIGSVATVSKLKRLSGKSYLNDMWNEDEIKFWDRVLKRSKGFSIDEFLEINNQNKRTGTWKR